MTKIPPESLNQTDFNTTIHWTGTNGTYKEEREETSGESKMWPPLSDTNSNSVDLT